MNKIEIELFIKEEMKKFVGDDKCTIDMQMDIAKSKISSLEFINLIVDLENKYNIEFLDEDLVFERYVKFSDIVDMAFSLIQK